VLVAAASLLRRLHDATVDFARPGASWRLPAREPREVVCHNDFAPHNLVFRGRELCGVIDFDTAAPGPRAWDLANTAHRLVPLTAPGNPDTPATPDGERARRLALLCGAYGTGVVPADVLALAPERLDALRAFTEDHAAATGAPELGRHAGWYAADAEYVRRRGPALARPWL
jgi:aminoglycoside phosphotransferase (APT) family kinase protein